METVKRLFISLLVLLGCSAGSWAIEQDSDGYYLIGSVQDWKDFAALVQTTPNANARMIADVDLGGDQTKIGATGAYDSSPCFSGTFDGQGYTLTVAYTGITENYVGAPFAKINGATIKNLHVAGTINSGGFHPSVVSDSWGTSTIENVWSSLVITSTRGGWVECGGIVGCMKNGNLTVRDCLFTGSITASGGYNGCFVGYKDGGTGTIINCLSLGTFSYPNGYNSWTSGPAGTHNNCFVKQYQGNDIPAAMKVTDEQLAGGTIATALQADRSEEIWVQDPLTKQPTLKIFATLKQDADGYYLIGSVQDWKNFAELVNSGTNPAANAKMIADVDLGDDQTMVGTYHQKYQGTFDGQGHTLIFNYNTAGMSPEPEQRAFSLDFLGAAPFRDIEGATILNLHTAGSVTAQNIGAAGLVGWTYGTNTIEKCWSDVDIVSSNNTADTFAGFVAFQYGTQLNIIDCVYTGKIQSTSKISHAGFVAFQRYGKTSLNNCLLLLDKGSDVNTTPYQNLMYYTFVRNHSEHYVTNTINNCYYLTPFGVAQGTQTTDGDISDGTTAAALQADRSEEIWVQDPVLGIPMLKLFANTEEAPVTDLSAKETANCYIVQAAGNYKFRATVKGNGSADLGGISRYTDASTIASAELVWATFNTTVTPEADELIKDIRYSNGYVYFSTGDIYKEGNALVAIKDVGGNILWSWHLWFESDDLDALVQTYPGSGYLVMDRNLGALTNCYAADNALDFGFAYQNGRKDPFMMSATRTRYTALGVLGTYTSSAGSSSLASSIQRPTVVFGTDSWGGSPDYWSASEKTIFDPCPPGWQVGPSDLWRASGFNSSTFVVKENDWATYHGCVFNGEAWYPATGDRWGGSHNNTGSLIRVWARGAGNALASNNGSAPTLGDGSNPGHGYSIRPVRIADFIYTVPVSGLGTFSADVNIIVPKGLTAYYCTTLKTYKDGSLGIKVSKLNGGIIPANTGVLFEGTGGQSYPLISTNVEATAPAGNSLVAVVESQHIAATEGDYTNFMMKGGKFIKIQQDDESVKMPANRAYLPLLTSVISGSNAKEILLYWDDEEATGIERMRNVENEIMRNGNIYNLNGQKLSAPQKGINIINGRKVIVK